MEQNDVFANQSRADDEHDERYELLAALTATGYVKKEAAREWLDPVNQAEAQTMPTDSARAALDWLISHHYARAEDEQAATKQLFEQLHSAERVDADVIRILKRLAGLDARFDAAVAARLPDLPVAMRVPDSPASRRTSILRGLGAVAAIAVGCFLVYEWLFAPSAVPVCDARSTINTLLRISFQANYKSRVNNPFLYQEDPDALTSDKGMISFSGEQEVGYDKDDDSRGCSAYVDTAGENTREKTGYTITRAQDGKSKDDFIVQILPYEFIAARYSATGLNKKLGAPVGRDAMRAAMVDALGKAAATADAYCPGCKAGADNDAGARAGIGDDTDASKQMLATYGPMTSAGRIMQIHPFADCRKLDANQYACPVQVEYQLPRSVTRLWLNLASVPPMPVLLKSDFVFERTGNNGSGSGWKMADGFDKTLAKAIAENMLTDGADDKPAPGDAKPENDE